MGVLHVSLKRYVFLKPEPWCQRIHDPSISPTEVNLDLKLGFPSFGRAPCHILRTAKRRWVPLGAPVGSGRRRRVPSDPGTRPTAGRWQDDPSGSRGQTSRDRPDLLERPPETLPHFCWNHPQSPGGWRWGWGGCLLTPGNVSGPSSPRLFKVTNLELFLSRSSAGSWSPTASIPSAN